jgi:co-chaperonin GroES (HSP10)
MTIYQPWVMTMNDIAFREPGKELVAELPLQPVGWRVLIRPYKPKDTWGESEIAIASEALESEELLTYVGQIVAMGDQCFKAVTRSGIDMSTIEPKPKVGDWVMFGTYGGQAIRMKNNTKYLIMNDDGIMGIVRDPAQFRSYL